MWQVHHLHSPNRKPPHPCRTSRFQAQENRFQSLTMALTQSQKHKLFQDNGFTCVTCGVHIQPGVRGLQADHKVPLSRGGGNEIHNWQPMCNNCNVGKRRACEGCSLDCQSASITPPSLCGRVLAGSGWVPPVRMVETRGLRHRVPIPMFHR